MAKKVTKYYVADTEEEVQLGDIIEIVLTKTNKKGEKMTKKDCVEVTPETLPDLLEMEIVEEWVEQDEDTVQSRLEEDDYDDDDEEDYEDECPPCLEWAMLMKATLKSLIEDFKEHDLRLKKLEEKVNKVQDRLNHKATKSSDKK